MTEEEWLTATDPDEMLGHLHGRLGQRRARLLGAACCRRVGHRYRGQHAISAVEKFADGRASEGDLSRAAAALYEERVVADLGGESAFLNAVGEASGDWSDYGADYHLSLLLYSSRFASGRPETPEKIAQCQIIRDIFGNPFRPVTVDPSWLTPAVVALADAIYAERAFDRMPILADALEESGCDHPDVLAHCRGGGPHARGCWVVDMMLGKG